MKGEVKMGGGGTEKGGIVGGWGTLAPDCEFLTLYVPCSKSPALLFRIGPGR